ncbi:hypothetical protein CR513_17233, partial [Mucuna pruriens]
MKHRSHTGIQNFKRRYFTIKMMYKSRGQDVGQTKKHMNGTNLSEKKRIMKHSHKLSTIKVINGGWWEAKIPPYKHAIVAYGTTIAGLPSQIAYGGGVEKRHISQ